MCLTIPKKVVEVNGDSVVVETHDGDRQTLKTLVGLSVGDFILSQQNVAIEKIEREYAEEIFTIIKRGGGYE